MEVSLWLWAGVLGFIALALLLDLFVLHRDAHEVSMKEAAVTSAVWVAFGAGFGLIVWSVFGAGDRGFFHRDLVSVAMQVVEAAGFGGSTGPRTGHGIGLDVHEPPSVVDGDETELVPGAAITVEPGVYLPGRFGIRIEDTVIVTDGAAERVTRGARPLFAR